MRKVLRKTRKGSTLDVFFQLTSIVLVAFFILLGFYLLTTIIGAFETTDSIDNSTITGAQDFENRYATIFDMAFLMFLIGFTIIPIIGASMRDTHPVFFGISMVMYIIFVFVAIILEYVYFQIAESSTFTTISASFPIISFTMNQLPFYVAGLGILIIIITHSKTK